VLTATSFVYRY